MKEKLLRKIGAIMALPWFKKIKPGKAIFAVFFLGLIYANQVIAAASTTVTPAKGTWVDSVVTGVSQIITYVTQGAGLLVTLMIGGVLMPIAKYNDFVNSPVVGAGWAVVRDAVNMFFVVIFIIIAFGTILGIQRFQWRQQVTRLLLMAIFINFSRMLCGIMIDFSQIFMLTFINAIKDIAGGNFIQMFGLAKVMDAGFGEALEIPRSAILIAAICGLIMMLIVLVTIFFITLAFLYRIVLLWGLVTLAPLAWFTKVLGGISPVGGKAYGDWWKKFSCALMLGPILAFFLWLALAVAGSGANISGFETSASPEVNLLNKALDPGSLITFIVGIALLVLGLDTANDACAGADGTMSKILGRASKVGKAIATSPYTVGAAATKWGGKQIWQGQSGGGGIKGTILGSKTVNRAAQALAQTPILGSLGGRALAQVVGENRIQSKSKREKFDQARAATVAKAGDFGDKSEAELQALLGKTGFGEVDFNPETRRAAIQTMAEKGFFKDDPSLTPVKRKTRIENIKTARKELENNPEALNSFDDRIRKQSPGFALETIYRDDKTGQIDQKKLREDIVNTKIGAGAILSGTNSQNANEVAMAMGGDAAERMKFLYDIFDGNVKNMKAAMESIEDSQIKNAMFGGINANQVIKMTEKEELDATGKKTGKKIDDFDKREAILSSILASGVDVGKVRDFYAPPGGGDLKEDAQKAMAKHVNTNAGFYQNNFDNVFDDKKSAEKARLVAEADSLANPTSAIKKGVLIKAKAKEVSATSAAREVENNLDQIFKEIGDRISGENVAKIRSGGNELKKALDNSVNASLVDFSNTLLANPTSASAKKQLEDAVERAVKGGAKIDLRLFGAPGSASINTINAKISGMKPEDLNKIRFESISAPTVGQLMWSGLDVSALTKLFDDVQNVDLLKAVKNHALTLPPTDPRRVALAKYLV